MRHPADGTLRRLVDDPAGVPDPDREHVASCAECLSRLAAAERDAAAAAAVLAPAGALAPAAAGAGPATGTDAAWHRLSAAVAAGPAAAAAVRAAAPPRVSRWRRAMRSPAVAGVGVAAVLAGASVAAAADWLHVFRTERLAPVTVTEAELVALPDLSSYGTLDVTSEPDVHPVASAVAAREATGLVAPFVDSLPRGVTGDPTYLVGDRASAVFTFSADAAARAAARAGTTLPPPPPGLDGARFHLEAGPGLAAVWSESHGMPALVVARAVAPTATSTGVPFETARQYLLSLPGLPPRVAAQLRQFTADGSTLPLPVPAQLVRTSTADVRGVEATVLTSRDGAFAGVVWVDQGIVNGVAGSLDTDEVLAVARRLTLR
ncbi:MAG TPA: hypothetical protein VF519_01310 [Mycobacteriales bacterium]|jgi:hypothetical protein